MTLRLEPDYREEVPQQGDKGTLLIKDLSTVPDAKLSAVALARPDDGVLHLIRAANAESESFMDVVCAGNIASVGLEIDDLSRGAVDHAVVKIPKIVAEISDEASASTADVLGDGAAKVSAAIEQAAAGDEGRRRSVVIDEVLSTTGDAGRNDALHPSHVAGSVVVTGGRVIIKKY